LILSSRRQDLRVALAARGLKNMDAAMRRLPTRATDQIRAQSRAVHIRSVLTGVIAAALLCSYPEASYFALPFFAFDPISMRSHVSVPTVMVAQCLSQFAEHAQRMNRMPMLNAIQHQNLRRAAGQSAQPVSRCGSACVRDHGSASSVHTIFT
jgi:hypothetical protein